MIRSCCLVAAESEKLVVSVAIGKPVASVGFEVESHLPVVAGTVDRFRQGLNHIIGKDDIVDF